ncbi:toxic anion resistance protein [Umezawaea endophytica]|uniref:Toxic anion resistance protein n=1 Tax=Umezawaea endophytica TaxID=1654476 RepID=A0A9X2VLC2_9PSEU|nr:toxic anion resistance protein [Umezawaea endophytica]MCS7477308.1 toxic anion resistance protein [Umezawaea endophytica]
MDADFVLTAPEPVAPVPVERAAGLIPVDDTTRRESLRRAEEFVAELSTVDVHSPEFTVLLDRVLVLGESDMRAAAQVAGRLLDRSLAALAEPGAQRQVTGGLNELRRTVRELDPKDLRGLTGRKLLGLIPFGGSARALLARFRAADEPLNRVVLKLRGGQDELRRDNAAVRGERERLWAVMTRLSADAVLAAAVDEAVDQQARIVELSDPQRATALRADVLHPVRVRHQDLLTQLAVCAQGYLALDVVRRGNDELIKGVERAVGTTVTALRIGMVVAAALADQREVVEQIDAVRGLTDGLLRANADLLSLQGNDIQRISSEPMVGVDAIRTSFDQVYATIDAIDTFKARAAESMAGTVSALDHEIRRAHDHLTRVRSTEEPA